MCIILYSITCMHLHIYIYICIRYACIFLGVYIYIGAEEFFRNK